MAVPGSHYLSSRFNIVGDGFPRIRRLHTEAIEKPYLTALTWRGFLSIWWREDFHTILIGSPGVLQCGLLSNQWNTVCEFPQNPVIVGLHTPEDHQLRLEAGECFFRRLFVGIHERVEDLKASNLFSWSEQKLSKVPSSPQNNGSIFRSEVCRCFV